MKKSIPFYFIILCLLISIAFLLFYPTNKKTIDEETIKIFFPESENINITAEIANNEKSRARGLMHRKKLDEDRGMLFIFPKEQNLSFWMKDTYIPLDIIFLDENKQITTIHQDSKPLDTGTYKSQYPSKYALEVNAGFCEKYTIKVKDQVVFSL
ncbi:DUF192 domain-containing protein [Candidatus Dojkabacteria bacterium]|nr:DUF192 domain-containing protein [Candidatus Dojkabacteria bacterium]